MTGVADGTQSDRAARLARGPVIVGSPAPYIEPRLASADPYRPDTIADGGTAYGLLVRAASVRGSSKRYSGGPRQDDLCLALHEPTRTLIVAVADGVSAAARSGLAAALAVRQATSAVAHQLDERGAAELDWADVFGQAAWALVEEHRRSTRDPDAGVEAAGKMLATTLIVAAMTCEDEADEGVSVQVAATGDSRGWILDGTVFEPLAGDGEDAGELLRGGVAALPRASAPSTVTSVRFARDTVLLLATDGFALPLADGTNDFALHFAHELAEPPDIADFARLLDFSRSTYDDDRTLVAIWARAAEELHGQAP